MPIIGSTFGLAFSISHFIFLFVQAHATSKVHLSDEELMSVSLRLCHFLMREYISPCGRFHISDEHMTQFPVLCDYIQPGRATQAETYKKFKKIYVCD
jgi:hypothetical protein